MTKSRKPQPPAHGLIALIRRELASRGLSAGAAARGIGISHSHLVDILNGKKTPDAGVCNAMAAFFNQPRVEILRLAGWLDDDPSEQNELERVEGQL